MSTKHPSIQSQGIVSHLRVPTYVVDQLEFRMGTIDWPSESLVRHVKILKTCSDPMQSWFRVLDSALCELFERHKMVFTERGRYEMHKFLWDETELGRLQLPSRISILESREYPDGAEFFCLPFQHARAMVFCRLEGKAYEICGANRETRIRKVLSNEDRIVTSAIIGGFTIKIRGSSEDDCSFESFMTKEPMADLSRELVAKIFCGSVSQELSL